MTFSTVAKLGAGSKLFFEDPATPDTYLLLDNALTIGQVGEQGEFIETTPISKTVRGYIRGLKTPPQKTLGFNDIPADANYQAFIAAWDDEANTASIKMRVDYSNGRRAEFNVVSSGRVVDEAQGSAQLQMMFFAQQSGATVWSEISE